MELQKLKNKAAEAFAKGKFNRAAELYDEYCQKDPRDLQARIRMGDAWARTGKRDKAIGAYRSAAEGFAKNGFFPRAIAASKLILELDPLHKGVQQMLADLYAQKASPSTGLGIGPPTGASPPHAVADSTGSRTSVTFSGRAQVLPDSIGPSFSSGGRGALELPSVDSEELPLVRNAVSLDPDAEAARQSWGQATQQSWGQAPPPSSWQGSRPGSGQAPGQSSGEAPRPSSGLAASTGPGQESKSGIDGKAKVPGAGAATEKLTSIASHQGSAASQATTPAASGPTAKAATANPPAKAAAGAEEIEPTGNGRSAEQAASGREPKGLAEAPAVETTARSPASASRVPHAPSPGAARAASASPPKQEDQKPRSVVPSLAKATPSSPSPIAQADERAQSAWKAAQAGDSPDRAPSAPPIASAGKPAREGRAAAASADDVALEVDLDSAPEAFTELELDGDSLLHAVERAARLGAAARAKAPEPPPRPTAAAPPAVAAVERREKLPTVPLFSDLTPEAFIELFERGPMLRFNKRQRVFEQGSIGQSFFIVCQGSVRVVREEDGRVKELAVLPEGSFFGEMALLSDNPRIASVEAASDETEVLEISAALLSELSKRHPPVAAALKKFCRQRLLLNVMNSSALFRPFDGNDRRTLIERFRAREVNGSTTIIRECQHSDGLYVILSGEMQVVKEGRVIALLREGDIFGEMSLLDKAPATATVSSTRRTSLLRLPREDFDELIMSHPQILVLVSELTDDRRRKTDAILSGAPATAEDALILV